MRRRHRRAHAALAMASATTSAWLLVAAWASRTNRPPAAPFIGPGDSAEPAFHWTVVLDTRQGPAIATYSSGPEEGWLHVSLPVDLDAAEPGLILEAPGTFDTLGSVNSVRSSVPAPQMPEEGGALVLVDFARDLRLAETSLPRSRR